MLTNQSAISMLLEELHYYGIFLVSVGELEGWASNKFAKGREWDDNVWNIAVDLADNEAGAFLQKISEWLHSSPYEQETL